MILPNFVVEETTVRESGEGAVFDIGQNFHRTLTLTFSITHAVEQQHIRLDIFGSHDGQTWLRPVLSFPPKCYCGEYQMTLPSCGFRYLKPVWRVNRWARNDQRPYFRFHLYIAPARAQAALAGAA